MKNIVLLLALSALPGLANANLLTNGSFEDTVQANGTWNVYTTIAGWTTETGPGIEIRNNVEGVAFDGNNFVELDSHANSSMFQEVATTSGVAYTLSFAYAPRINQSAETNIVEAYWNGSLITSQTGFSATNNDWQTFSFTVTGTGLDKLTFKAAGINDSYGGSLDNVTLTAAVPEPETYAMMLFGLGLVGFAARRKGTAYTK